LAFPRDPRMGNNPPPPKQLPGLPEHYAERAVSVINPVDLDTATLSMGKASESGS
jgi:hypothetical protein